MNSHHVISSSSGSVHVIAVPGRRKFWKWSDFALSEADVAVIVVKSGTNNVNIEEFLEPLFLSLGLGCENVLVVINASGANSVENNATEVIIKRDISRVFGSIVDRVPIQTVDVSSAESVRSLFDRLAEYKGQQGSNKSEVFIPITSIFQREGFVIVEGKVLCGRVTKGDELFLMPSGLSLRVESIQLPNGIDSENGTAGALVALKFSGISKAHIATGMILVSDPSVGRPTRLLRVELSFVNNRFPIRSGFSPMISFMSSHVHGKIASMEKDPAEIGDNTIGVLSLQKTVFTAPYSAAGEIQGLGRLVLRQENVVIAVGVVRDILD